jgi:membrane protein implicated in regulation of membrane protease activity
MANLFYSWLVLGLLFLLLEITNPTFFFFFSFFVGSLVAALLNFGDSSFYLQLSVFFGASITTFVVLCLWLKIKPYGIQKHGYRSNIFALQGKKGLVLEEIRPFDQGLIKIGGELWSAKAVNNEQCGVGSVVEIIDVVGCHCMVKIIHEK